MFPLKYGETVTRIRRQMVLDPYSQEMTQGSWEDAAELPIPGCAVAPSSSVEQPSDDRQMVDTSMSLYCGQGSDVLASDRILARSGIWEVAGHDLAWTNPFTGWAPGSEFRLRRVEG